jgi:lysine-specific histone demethylase 1
VQPSFSNAEDLDYEAGVVGAILSQIGDRPTKPSRPGVNPFLLFTKQKWEECKAFCSAGSSKDNPAGRDAIRATLGKWWKAATEEEKAPYLAQSQVAQEQADAVRKEWSEKAAQWDVDAKRIRQEYVREHPPPKAIEAPGSVGGSMEGVGVSKRKTNVSNNVVLDHH